MKRITFFALSLILTVLNCNAQNNWKPGYIIENAGDTIYGFIDNRDSRSNSKQCYFRKEEQEETKTFEPKDISGFRFIDGKFFISKTVPSGDSTRRMFLEFIIHGQIDIFHYKDDGDYYFIEKDGQLFRLQNTSEIQKIDGILYEHEKKEYLGILNRVLQDADMRSEIDNSTLATKSLINVAKKYQELTCSDEQCIVYEKKDKIHVGWGLHFGKAVNTFNFGDRFVTNYNITSYIGCRFKFENVLDWAENVSFTTEITFQKFSKYELREINYNELVFYNDQRYILNEGDKLNVDLKMTVLKVPITVNYVFSHRKVRPYINIGLSNAFVLAQNKDFIFSTFYTYFNKSVPIYSILGFVGRAGCEFGFKNGHSIYFDIDLDYTQNSKCAVLIFTNKMYSLTLGYAF